MAGQLRAAVPWWREQDYERVRAMMNADDHFPERFEEWVEIAERQSAEFIAEGVAVERVVVNLDEFIAFCRLAGVEPDRKAAVAYAVHVIEREQPGHA